MKKQIEKLIDKLQKEIEEVNMMYNSCDDNDKRFYYMGRGNSISWVKQRLEKLNEEAVSGDEVCVNCDQSKSTHHLCGECLTKIIEQNKQT